MKQISKKTSNNGGCKRKKKITDKRLPPKQKVIKKRNHPKFGTSKAEQDFAKDFLDKLGIDYEWQFEAKEIHRFFDFKTSSGVLIEFDGFFFHADDRYFKDEDLTPMQRKNRRVDEEKNKWAALHGMPLIRVREKDVKEHPDKVMQMLRERLRVQDDILDKERNFNKRHVNRLND